MSARDEDLPSGAPARVLAVGGSDPSGGAGIQADLKTATALGAYSAGVVTAITVQDTLEVRRVSPVAAYLVREQLEAVLRDVGADVVKVGMLPTAAVARVVAEVLEATPGRAPLVLDPVAYAGTGAVLAPEAAREIARALLVPRAALVTPNVAEAELLGARTISDERSLRAAAERLLLLGPAAVLVKGGHLPGDAVTDVLATADGDVHVLTAPRIGKRGAHGTGCTLASAIAVGMAEGRTLLDAVQRARDYVRRALVAAPGLGRGVGPLAHWVGDATGRGRGALEHP